MMHWFYAENIAGGFHDFDPEESRHAIKVLRLRRGDRIVLTDGRGHRYTAEISDDNIRHCQLRIVDHVQVAPRDFRLHIAVAPTKNLSRLEWFLEKATEIGIEAITPLRCAHSERVHLRTDRLEKIIITALKQSQQIWLPRLNPLTEFDDLVGSNLPGQKFIAYVSPDHDRLLQTACRPNEDATILIGPEGDFGEEEIARAISAGYLPISLGKNRLRTETAALVACHTVTMLNQAEQHQ